MLEYPGNSREQRRSPPKPKEEKKVEQVVTGSVKYREKTLGSRFHEAVFGSGTKSVFEYVAENVLIPAIKDMMSESGREAIDRLIFRGEVPSDRRNRSNHSYNRSAPRDYSRYSPSSRRDDDRREPVRRSRNSRELEDFVLETRIEATRVLECMYDILETYERVSVHDLRELLGDTPLSTDDKWGWDDLGGVVVKRVREGFTLNLPDPEPIER